MSLFLAAALAASAASLPTCSWDRPGANPFMGNVVTAVDRYTDIPAPVREALKKRMAARQYDEIATIKRDSIEGKARYDNLRDMHFGQGQVCNTVTRDKWAPATVERGLVYCESGHCIIVPTVCRNVSRVSRAPQQKAAAATGGTPGADSTELQFDPPAAGAPADGPAGPADAFAGRSLDALPGPVNGPAAYGGGYGAGYGSPAAAGWVGSGAGGPSFASATGFGGGAAAGGGASTGGLLDPTEPRSRETLGISSGPKPFMPPPAAMAPVPEPGTWALMAAGLVLLLAAQKRQGQHAQRAVSRA